MELKRIGAVALTLTMLLSGCGGEDSQEQLREDGTVAESGNFEDEGSSAEPSFVSWDYKDLFCNFQMKLPKWTNDNQQGMNYVVTRFNDEDHGALMVVSHYSEENDGADYDGTNLDTAEHALEELFVGKADAALNSVYDYHVLSADVTTEATTVSGLEAVRFSGTVEMDWTGMNKTCGTVGYCVLGSHRPILFYAMDMSDAQNQMGELGGIVDEVSATFVDGE